MNYLRLIITLFCFVLAGCSVTFRHNDTIYGNVPSETLSSTPSQFDITFEPGTLKPEENTLRDSELWRGTKFKLQRRNTGKSKNDIVSGEFILQKHPFGHRMLVLLLPGTGENESTEGSGEKLAQSGVVDVIRIHSGIDFISEKRICSYLTISEDELRALFREGNEVIRNRLCDLRMLIMLLDRIYDYESIGISGVSLGGIFAPLEASSIKNPKSVLILVSGGNIAEILRTSREKNIVKMRSALEERFEGSPDRLWRIAREEFNFTDPLWAAEGLDPATMHIAANYWDHVIRYRYAVELWEKARRPDFEVIFFPPGHYGSALLLWIPLLRFEVRYLGPIPYLLPYAWERVPGITYRFFKKQFPQ